MRRYPRRVDFRGAVAGPFAGGVQTCKPDACAGSGLTRRGHLAAEACEVMLRAAMASLERSVLRPVLCATLGLASAGCVAGWWPKADGDDAALGACLSTRRAPAIPQSANPDERLVADATDAQASVVDVEIDAHGEDFVGAVRVSHGVGTIELGCQKVPLAVYRTFTSAGVRGVPRSRRPDRSHLPDRHRLRR